jgi:hypothetical protein
VLGIVFAVLAIDDREMDLSVALAISGTRGAHCDSGVDDRLEPGEVA